MEVNWMGYLFVFDRTQFVLALHTAPASSDEVVAKLAQLASQVPHVAKHGAYTKSEFDRLYFAGAAASGEWQERVPDEEITIAWCFLF